ncbi:SatD family protein [Cyclobacterium jeungdonense]|uniref:SatD family protein n=1 Tax=Cyclobacterium jeungdonense TaxID=708087 RepID=A0ABT8CF32_9BACT|nr:SatD family protein [Cyclobacterium jeungdonense]MDN3690286.1 SatD family protein [Cyclobacterium jeungdonense]
MKNRYTQSHMMAIITGDIKGSRKVSADLWMKTLKEELNTWGKPVEDWEIYRGDSFQLKIKKPEDLLQASIRLKAAIRSIDPLDCRMGMGIGTEDFKSKRLLENNGTAYIHSGDAFGKLSDNHQSLLLKTSDAEFDEEINLMLKMSLAVMNNWTCNSARMVYLALTYPEKSQTQLGGMEGISQHAVSARLSRAYFDLTQSFLAYFPKRLKRSLP